MKKKLVWKNKEKKIVLKDIVFGYFVMWATRQSPYLYPEKLTKGLEEFKENFIHDETQKINIKNLGEEIKAAIENSPTIVSWNKPKKGNAKMIICSRFDQPKPDYDCIDLDALTRNIEHSVWLELCYDDGWFE